MALPAKIDTAEAMAQYIYASTDWSSSYEVHAMELPVGWSLTAAVLILPDGGMGRDIPVADERFTFWCYGLTPSAARAVADTLFRVLHRRGPESVTITAGTASIGPVEWAMGPTYLREPDTEWPRWVCAVDATFAEWCLDGVAANVRSTSSYWPEGFWQEEA